MASTFRVTTTDMNSSEQGSLLYALANAVSGDTVLFQIVGTFTLPGSVALPVGTVTFASGGATGAASGTVNIQGGTLLDPASGRSSIVESGANPLVFGSTLTFSGTTTIAGNVTITGMDTSKGAITLQAGGSLAVSSQGVVAQASALTVASTFTNSGSVTATTVTSSATADVRSSGTLAGSKFTNNGSATLTGTTHFTTLRNVGTIGLQGSLQIVNLQNTGTMTLTGPVTGFTGDLDEEAGTLDLGGQTLSANGGLALLGGVLQNGTVTSTSGFHFEAGTVSAVLSGSGTSTDYNYKDGNGTAVLSGANTFNGDTELYNGTLEIASPSGAGTSELDFLNGGFATTIKVDKTALGNDASHTFANLISFFKAKDTIDVGGIGTATPVFNYSTKIMSLIENGTTVASLRLYGDYKGEVFSGSADGNGGTKIIDTGTAPTVSITGVTGGSNIVDHVVSGTIDLADAGSSVTVLNNGMKLGTATSDANGNWSLPFVYTADGAGTTYDLTATTSNSFGSGTSAHTVFHLDSTPNQSSFGTISYDTSHPGGEVYALYEGLLGRAPDAQGAEGWVASLNDGTSIAQVAQALLTSPEGQQTFPASDSNQSFVDTLYQKVLGRSADAGGEQAWVNALNGGESRADVADSFVFSNEHISELQPALNAGIYVADANTSEVARLYYGLLNRAPDQGSLSANTQALDNGTSVQALAQSFINSSEYQSQYANLSNSAFVTDLYRNALGRAPDQSGLQSWDNQLTAGASRASVAIGIVESQEAQNHLAGKIETGFHFV